MDVDYDGFLSERECTPSRATSPAPPSGAAASGSASGSTTTTTSQLQSQSQSHWQSQTPTSSSGPGPSSTTALASGASHQRRFLDDRDPWSKDVEVHLAGLTLDRTGFFSFLFLVLAASRHLTSHSHQHQPSAATLTQPQPKSPRTTLLSVKRRPTPYMPFSTHRGEAPFIMEPTARGFRQVKLSAMQQPRFASPVARTTYVPSPSPNIHSFSIYEHYPFTHPKLGNLALDCLLSGCDCRAFVNLYDVGSLDNNSQLAAKIVDLVNFYNKVFMQIPSIVSTFASIITEFLSREPQAASQHVAAVTDFVKSIEGLLASVQSIPSTIAGIIKDCDQDM
ncbi:hypothetical protein BD410DRAFT_844985 [Rickenella mellea]|uniref:Uncharacterized protein n=1 Tax=Rickenella mellea TaxID=50990 RepID=A0A4Y7PJQ9_9AGAM|nr:hypothetical protein BD410DRAFT_844985 [Rickenella mellea]